MSAPQTIDLTPDYAGLARGFGAEAVAVAARLPADEAEAVRRVLAPLAIVSACVGNHRELIAFRSLLVDTLDALRDRQSDEEEEEDT